MNAGAVLLLSQNRYMRALREAGATSADSAVTLEALDLRDSIFFRHLVRRGVVQSAEGGRYWLVEAEAKAFVRRRRVFVASAVAIVVMFAVLLPVLLND